MKNLTLTTLLFSIILTFSLNACNKKTGTGESSVDEVEFASAYVCPMRCEGSGSDQPGKCPVCKMDYVANPNHETENTSTGNVTFACSMHPEVTGNTGDSCNVCKMALVPQTLDSGSVGNNEESEDESEE